MSESKFTSARPAPLRDDADSDIEAQPFQVCEWRADTPVLTVATAVKCERRHGVTAALSRAYELELRNPHKIVRTRPVE